MHSELGKPERDAVSVGQSEAQRWSFGKVPRSIGATRCFRGLLRSDAALAELPISCGSRFPLLPDHRPKSTLEPSHPLLGSRTCTPTFLRKGQTVLVFCRLSVVESRRVLIAPFIPLRGPFGPSLLAQLLRPLLTSATGSETISRLSVSNSRPVADLPR
jgi:hypothetical protein